MVRWSMYIDIEGFSAIYAEEPDRAKDSLSKLMHGLYRVGKHFPVKEVERLFIHQIGDGFVVVSDFPEPTLSRPVAIATALMQWMLMDGGLCRAGISCGDFSDVRTYFSEEVEGALGQNADSLSLRYGGVMTVFPVMGTALVNCYRVQEKSRVHGPLVFVEPELVEQLPKTGLVFLCQSRKYLIIDWINSTPPLLDEVFAALGAERPDSETLRAKLREYVADPSNCRLSFPWKASSLAMAGMRSS